MRVYLTKKTRVSVAITYENGWTPDRGAKGKERSLLVSCFGNNVAKAVKIYALQDLQG